MAHELIFREVFITFSPLIEFATKYSISPREPHGPHGKAINAVSGECELKTKTCRGNFAAVRNGKFLT